MASIHDLLQKFRRVFFGLRLKNGVMKATDDELRLSVESSERTAEIGSIALLVGLVVEMFLAVLRPQSDSFARIWGRFVADLFVFLGVGAEVLFSRMGAARQHELQRRSDEQLGVTQKEAADARERTAVTELRLEELRQRVGPRNFDRGKFLAAIQGKTAPHVVQIQYDESVPDGWPTGWQMQNLLKEAGWNVLDPVTIAPRSHFWTYVPRVIESGADGAVIGTGAGIVVVYRYGESLSETLMSAINVALGFPQARYDSSVPENGLIVLIFGRS